MAAGLARVTTTSPGSAQTASNVVIAPLAPAVFTANGNALIAGYVVRVSAIARSNALDSTPAMFRTVFFERGRGDLVCL